MCFPLHITFYKGLSDCPQDSSEPASTMPPKTEPAALWNRKFHREIGVTIKETSWLSPKICDSSFPAACFVGEQAAKRVDHSSEELENPFAISQVKSGDKIEWKYTCTGLGTDVGAERME